MFHNLLNRVLFLCALFRIMVQLFASHRFGFPGRSGGAGHLLFQFLQHFFHLFAAADVVLELLDQLLNIRPQLNDQDICSGKPFTGVVLIERAVDHRNAVVQRIQVRAGIPAQVIYISRTAILEQQVDDDRILMIAGLLLRLNAGN